MSTRSLIAVRDNGVIKAVYCHNDDYPEDENDYPCNGKILREYYNSREQALELIELGSLYYIGPRIKPESGEAHSMDEPNFEITMAHHRDWGEELEPAAEYASSDDLYDDRENHFAEYIYLFDNGRWVFTDGFAEQPNWIVL